MADIDNIELRSEKTRQIIGMVPNRIVRYGTLIISVIIIALLLAAYFIPYPDNLKVNAMIVVAEGGGHRIQAYVPYSYVSTIHEGMNASIEFEGYPSADYGFIAATVNRIDKEVRKIKGQNFFAVYMNIQNTDDITLLLGMNGTANILVSDKSVLQKLFT